jgi:ABC-type Fe3+-hydroxamate transport system substrate-binding protein
LGNILHLPQAAQQLTDSMQRQFAHVDSLRTHSSIHPYVLVLHSSGPAEGIFIHGIDTPVNFFLEQAGATNAAQHTGMLLVDPKSAFPDAAFLLVEDSTLAKLGGADALRQHKTLRALRAVQQNKVFALPSIHLYGPNSQAATFTLWLAQQLHGAPAAATADTSSTHIAK